MKVKLNGVKLELDIPELIENLDAEAKREIAKCLIWDDETLFAFVDAITMEYAAPFYNSNLFDARLRLQEQAPEATRNVVRALLHEQKSLRDEKRRANDWAWKMFHLWPAENFQSRPHLPDWMPSESPTDAEVESTLKGERATNQV